MVFMHASGNYFGQNYCAVVTGPKDAAGNAVTVQGQQAVLKMGKCSPLMMGGGPYMTMKPKDYETSNGKLVHWDGKVWSI